MESSVRYLHFSEVEGSRSGCKPALCLRGVKFASCVFDDDCTMRVIKVELRDFDKMKPVLYQGKADDPKRVAQAFLDRTTRETSRREATLKALELIDRVLKGDTSEEVIEVEPQVTVSTRKTTSPEDERPGLLAAICKELGLEGTVARRRLRKAGLHAPYSDEGLIRAALFVATVKEF